MSAIRTGKVYKYPPRLYNIFLVFNKITNFTFYFNDFSLELYFLKILYSYDFV